MSLQKCANLVVVRTDSRMRDMLLCLQSLALIIMLLSLLSGEIYLRLKPHLFVKVSSDIVTEHCCQVCIQSMIFCHFGCRCETIF